MFGSASAFVLGFPDKALGVMRDGLNLAKTLDHPLSIVMGGQWLAIIHLLRGEAREAEPILDHAIRTASEAAIPCGMWANFLSGWALSLEGRASDGVSRALSDFEAVGAAGQETYRVYYTGVLADMCRSAGRLDDGLRFVDKAIAAAAQDHWCLAELHRIKGELMLACGELAVAVEPCFETAITIAREQSAKSWELRAAVSHARLLRSHGRSNEGKELLKPIYDWFTEGFGIPDLKDAKALLEMLSRGNGP
jgi:predicted ATPase